MEMKISSQGAGMSEALEQTEKLAAEGDLSEKEKLRVRLLAEELIGMMRGIAGDVEADYMVEREGKAFTLRLGADVAMNREMREQLIAVSSNKENTATGKGLMGKILEMIAVAMLPGELGDRILSGLSLGFMSMESTGYQTTAETRYWTLTEYREAVDAVRTENEEAEEAWDELEKSIVASIADEVCVSVRGNHAEIEIRKTF